MGVITAQVSIVRGRHEATNGVKVGTVAAITIIIVLSGDCKITGTPDSDTAYSIQASSEIMAVPGEYKVVDEIWKTCQLTEEAPRPDLENIDGVAVTHTPSGGNEHPVRGKSHSKEFPLIPLPDGWPDDPEQFTR